MERARLTQEQRARRRVTRNNNRAKREMPLLAWGSEQPTTTYEAELAAVQGHDAAMDRHRQRHVDIVDEMRAEAMALRAHVALHVCADELSFLDSLVAASCPFEAARLHAGAVAPARRARVGCR